MKILIPFLTVFFLFLASESFAQNQVNTTLADFFLAGSQPNQSGNLESPDKCDNCHGGYDQAVEPAFNWRGSMMSQAARDPFFYACMTIANQDAAFAGDLCIRCHSPSGWLEGRSVPTDGSALNSNDREGVQCDFCHKMVDPTPLGVNPYSGDPDYTGDTYPADQSYLSTLLEIPSAHANGMYVADNDNAKRGPFVDANAKHQMYYSPFHAESKICGTCHDVSNPVFEKQIVNGEVKYLPGPLGAAVTNFDPYSMFPVERTYSEWLMSDYNSPEGVYAPQFGGNKTYVSTCQDCHMRDVSGVAANKRGTVYRDDLPLHDLTGGNTWVPDLITIFFPDEVDPTTLAAGKQRAAYMLQKAASLDVSGSIPNIAVTVTNETGHKLPSGYPEGRRIWLNVKAFDAAGNIIQEFGKYDYGTAGLTTSDTKVYETKLGMSPEIQSLTGRSNLDDGSSFHFAINNTIVKDNRIPPRGFTNANFESIQASPVGYSYADGQNYDVSTFALPSETVNYEVNLYYQTASKEYVEFLRDENVTNSWGDDLYNAWLSTGMSAPVLMNSFSSGGGGGGGGGGDDTEPPTVPANLLANAVSSDLVTLSWDPSTDNVGVAGYYVYRDDKGSTPIATVTTTTYSDGTVRQKQTFTYHVTAFDAAGNESAASNTQMVNVPGKGGKPPKNNRLVSGKEHGHTMLHPNPFNPETVVLYTARYEGHLKIEVYDITGSLVNTLADEDIGAGVFSTRFRGLDHASGVYFFVMQFTPNDKSIAPTVNYAKGLMLK